MPETLTDLLIAQHRNPASLNVSTASDRRAKISYSELYDNARRRLTDLQAKGLRERDFLVLYLYDEIAFIESFWACILGRIVPVPVAPGNTPEHKNKLLLVAEDLGGPFVMSERTALKRFEEHFDADALLLDRVITFEPLTPDTPKADPVPADPDDLAYVQFSSGSTRKPKGVQLTHHNLVTNIEDLCHAFGLDQSATSLSWMPLTHDMGLIGFHLCPLSVGIEQHILRTSLFVRRPLSWLQIAADVGATTLGSPNFGYRHWLQAQQNANAPLPDMSKVRQIINGAEPISLELMTEFMDALAPAGLSHGAMCPSYGLAEASLGIAVAPPGPGARAIWVDRAKMKMGAQVPILPAPDPTAMSFAIEGPVFSHSEMRIGSLEGENVGEAVLGEIQIRGSNVTKGYLNQPEANAELFTPDGWLRTSDLGFFYKGELVVTGRMKDMIVANGQNFFAHDIELMAEQAGLAKTGEVATGVMERDGQECFAMFLRERRPSADFVARARAVKELIYRTCGLQIVDVVPVRSIPKTTSGKLRRAALAQSLDAGEFDTVLAELFETQVNPEKESA